MQMERNILLLRKKYIEMIENYSWSVRSRRALEAGRFSGTKCWMCKSLCGRKNSKRIRRILAAYDEKIKQGFNDWYARTKENRKDKNKEYRDNIKKNQKSIMKDREKRKNGI